MADGVWKWVQSQVIGCSDQLLLNKFFDPSTPSMRKGDDGEEKRKKTRKKKVKRFLVATNVVASRPPERRPTETPTARANYNMLLVGQICPTDILVLDKRNLDIWVMNGRVMMTNNNQIKHI